MDPLSDVLRSLRLDGAVYLAAEFTAPWCAHAGYGMPHRRLRAIGADHVIFFHCLTEGACRVRLASGGPDLLLRPGDVVLFPHDDGHLLGSDLDTSPLDARRDADRDDGHGSLLTLRHGGGGASTRFVCGYLACNRRVSHGLLSSLPPMFHVSLQDDDTAWLFELLQIGLRESALARSGGQSILGRLSELLFTEAMRRYCESPAAVPGGWLDGMRDPVVSRALAAIHREPSKPWTVSMLAHACASSRSSLGGRFTRLLGQSPMQYLAQHRLALAAQHLQSSRRPIAEIAIAVGYGSEPAFTRAFKRAYGEPPSRYRLAVAAGGS